MYISRARTHLAAINHDSPRDIERAYLLQAPPALSRDSDYVTTRIAFKVSPLLIVASLETSEGAFYQFFSSLLFFMPPPRVALNPAYPRRIRTTT